MVVVSMKAMVRDLKRQGIYTLINVFGLAVGMAVCLLVLLFLQREFSYDGFHKDGANIYRMTRYRVPLHGGTPFYAKGLEGPAGPLLVAEIPEIEAITRVLTREMWGGTKEKGFDVRGAIADPNFLSFFTFPTVTGQAVSELKPGAVYVTARFAKKLFGTLDVVGQMIRMEYKWLNGDFYIADVLQDVPDVSTSDLSFDIVIHRDEITQRWVKDSWLVEWRDRTPIIRTFARLMPGVAPENLRTKLDAFAKRHLGDRVARNDYYEFVPLGRVHLYGQRDYGWSLGPLDTPALGDIYYCYAVGAVGGFLLFIACVNFVNLSTARAEDRALEVGVRKAVGATQGELVVQFLIETFTLTLLATGLSVGLALALIPYVNGLMGTSLVLNGWSWIFLGVMMVFAGLAAGVYPAFLLASFRPDQVLKSGRSVSSGRSVLRQGLVVGQFVIAVVMVIVTLVVQAQMQFVQAHDPGFRKQGLVVLPLYWQDRLLQKKSDVIRERFLASPDVVGVSASRYPPGWGGDPIVVSRPGIVDSVNVYELAADHDFTRIYDIAILDGRAFTRADQELPRVMVNQTAARILGDVKPGDTVLAWHTDFEVVGIFEDFHNKSLHIPIRPLLIMCAENFYFITLDIRSDNMQRTLRFLESVWKEFLPTRAFEFEFFDDHLAHWYRKEMQTQHVLMALSSLTILVACLGLLGLIAHAVRGRVKEIGVRKVLGASVGQIVLLLLKDLAKPVLIANVVAWPVAYVVANHWLERFAYRIDLGLDLFLMGGALALMIALATVVIQAFRAAQANPVAALRNE